MKLIYRIFFFLLLWGGMFLSCRGTETSSFSTSAVIRSDSCRLDPLNKYEVYIPKREKSDEQIPLLLILDAHGSGRFALTKFISAADQYHCLLVASDRVKNDVPDFESLIENLVQDVQQKYPVQKVIFLSGFSGGARMALQYAMSHPVDGLLMCGAMANPEQLRNIQCLVFSISGLDDFNFIETAPYLFPIDKMPTNLNIRLTHASHDWPDSSLLSDAIGFLRLSCRSNHLPHPSLSELLTYEQKQNSFMDTAIRRGDFLQAALMAHSMVSAFPFDTVPAFKQVFHRLTANPAFQKELTSLNQSIMEEMNLRSFYMNAFFTQDQSWWQAQINNLNQQIKTDQNDYMHDMYVRLKAFLGIACYSMSQQAVMANDDFSLAKILFVYRLLEPHNPDMFYFSAFIPYRKGDKAAAVLLLKQALQSGFSDRSRLQKDFPSLPIE